MSSVFIFYMSVRIIGVGASAGGIQALEAFLSELPRGLNLALVVVQHLSPDYASSMATILQRATDLSVSPLQDKTIPLADHVYIKPPDFDVRLHQLLTLVPRTANEQGLYLPIDDFFFSLAEARGKDAIGIVFSGMGTDGSRGLGEIKERGGFVMVQQPDTAQFDGMPRAAIRRQAVDVILPPDQLASRLASVVKSDEMVVAQISDLSGLNRAELMATMLERVRRLTGIDFKHYRQSTILRRIEKRMLIMQQESVRAYIECALGNEEELQILRQSFLIGVTRFFRDREAFDILRDEVIPQLFELTSGRELRLWIPACSTGEEVYSLAILLEEHCAREKLSCGYKIFCSDVDRRSVSVASRGEYDETIIGDVSAEHLAAYFQQTSSGFRVKKHIRERILFAVQNLLEDPPFIRIDFVSCRNFLIYVSTEVQQRILSNFHFALNPAGYLMLGPSESLGGLQSAFATINRRWKVYQKRLGGRTRGGTVVTPSIGQLDPTRVNVAAELSVGERPAPGITVANAKPTPTALQPPTMDYYSRHLAERYAPATLFVNARYEVLYLNGEFEGILRLPRFSAPLSLRNIINEQSQNLLTAGVDQVLRTGKAGKYDRIKTSDETAPNDVYMQVRFDRQEFYELDESVAVLQFFPIDAPRTPVTEQEETYSVDARLQDRIKGLELELRQSEGRAQKLLNELEATNEELQASNRELMASNEEMQSTNEELQSVNEELYTVNNEFQRKNDELNEINNDVSNLLKSTQISTIFVDNNLCIRRFTPGVGQQFDLHASDIGRPITNFASPFPEVDLEELCLEVIRTGNRHDQEAVDKQGNFFLVRLLPYLTEQERGKGIVVTIVDINDLVRSRRRYTDLALKYEAIFDNAQEVIAVIKPNSRIEEINQPISDQPVEALLGSYFTDLIATDPEKVRFNDLLRTSIDRNAPTTMMASLVDSAAPIRYITIEIIPIKPLTQTSGAAAEIEQAMILLHDVTDREEHRLKSARIIEMYQLRLDRLQQAAGLLDLKGRFVTMNHSVRGLELRVEDYLDKNISDFLTQAGMRRFRGVVDRLLKKESNLVRVTYPLDELSQDIKERSVIYRPVYAGEKLVFISFELQETT